MGMKAIAVPVRERILYLYDQGKSTCDIAASLGCCVAAVRRVRQHFKVRGTLESQTHRCGRKTRLTARRRERLQSLLAQHPDATLADQSRLTARVRCGGGCVPFPKNKKQVRKRLTLLMAGYRVEIHAAEDAQAVATARNCGKKAPVRPVPTAWPRWRLKAGIVVGELTA
jgi:Homeodomain-like domain